MNYNDEIEIEVNKIEFYEEEDIIDSLENK